MKHYLSFIGLILIIGILTQEYVALETDMLIVKEINISMNLTPDYNTSYVTIPDQREGVFGQMILINNTKDENKTASLMIISFSDKSILEIEASEVLNYFKNIIFGAFKIGGAKEMESYNLTNRYNQNVTIHALLMPGSDNSKFSRLQYMGLWDFDKLNYFFIVSEDKNLTREIIESLDVKDPSIDE